MRIARVILIVAQLAVFMLAGKRGEGSERARHRHDHGGVLWHVR